MKIKFLYKKMYNKKSERKWSTESETERYEGGRDGVWEEER